MNGKWTFIHFINHLDDPCSWSCFADDVVSPLIFELLVDFDTINRNNLVFLLIFCIEVGFSNFFFEVIVKSCSNFSLFNESIISLDWITSFIYVLNHYTSVIDSFNECRNTIFIERILIFTNNSSFISEHFSFRSKVISFPVITLVPTFDTIFCDNIFYPFDLLRWEDNPTTETVFVRDAVFNCAVLVNTDYFTITVDNTSTWKAWNRSHMIGDAFWAFIIIIINRFHDTISLVKLTNDNWFFELWWAWIGWIPNRADRIPWLIGFVFCQGNKGSSFIWTSDLKRNRCYNSSQVILISFSKFFLVPKMNIFFFEESSITRYRLRIANSRIRTEVIVKLSRISTSNMSFFCITVWF